MSEVGGITELQVLQAEVEILRSTLSGVQSAPKTSSTNAKLLASIKANEARDGFVVKEGESQAETNQFHTAAATSSEGGCCVVL